MDASAAIPLFLSFLSLILAFCSYRYSRQRDHWREEAARTIATLDFSDRLDKSADLSYQPKQYPQEDFNRLRELLALCDSRAVDEELLFTTNLRSITHMEYRASGFLKRLEPGRKPRFEGDLTIVGKVQKRLERWK